MFQTVPGNVFKDIISGIAITICIFAVSVYLPIAGFFCALFIPLPILFYRSKLGREIGAIVPVAAIVLMVIIAGRLSVDIYFFIGLLFLGFALSELLQLNLSVEKTILYASGFVLLAGFAGLFFYSSISSTGIKALVSGYVAKNLELTLALYKSMDMSEENIRMISNSLDRIQYALVRIIPALVIATTLFIAWTNLLLARRIFTRRNLSFPDFGPLTLWHPPEPLVWGVIGFGGMLLMPNTAIKMFGLNGLIILMTIYFFGGIAIVSFFLEKKKVPSTFRVFLYVLVAIQQFILLVVIGIGFFDTWLNFRKMEKSAE